MKKYFGRGLLVLAIIAIFMAYKYFDLGQYLSLQALKDQRESLVAAFEFNPSLVAGLYLLIYIVSTAVSLPGATILTLAGGAIFGLGWGLLLVSFASTIGATLAFLGSRFLLRDWVRLRFGQKLKKIDHGVEKEGGFYLFTLRLVPAFPFFLINLAMGLTPISVVKYFFISQLGMLPGTIVFVNAGTQLAKIDGLSGILSPQLLASFALIGILPLFSKKFIEYIKRRKYVRRFKKPKKFEYNMVVIGGGSAGLVSSYIAAAVKAKVALIEKHKMGGDCLNTGCVPSKALIRSAKVLNLIKRSKEFGFGEVNPQVNFSEVMNRIQKVIQKIEPHDSIERYSGLGVECITGDARIKSPYEVEVNGKILTTKNIVIATGARPLVPPFPGLDKIDYLTSDNLWGLREQPKRLLVLGGGPIGCELAQSFARLGSQVTICERRERLLEREDLDISTEVQRKFEADGIRVLTRHSAISFENQNTLLCQRGGQTVRVEFDKVLIALGRAANVKGFGLEELDIETNYNGTITVDEKLRTTRYPNIYACGDVAGPYQFTHVAAHQAWYVAVNALFSPLKTYNVDYRVIPWCTFTDPEVARVGLNETDAGALGIPFEVTKYGIDDLDRAIAEGEDHGFVKVLTVPGKDTILGATIVGEHAGEIISEYVAAMKHGFGMNKILGTIHIYPTMAEANKYAAGVWKKAHAPEAALKFLSGFHGWRRG